MILIKQTHNPKLVPNMLLNDSTIYTYATITFNIF